MLLFLINKNKNIYQQICSIMSHEVCIQVRHISSHSLGTVLFLARPSFSSHTAVLGFCDDQFFHPRGEQGCIIKAVFRTSQEPTYTNDYEYTSSKAMKHLSL